MRCKGLLRLCVNLIRLTFSLLLCCLCGFCFVACFSVGCVYDCFVMVCVDLPAYGCCLVLVRLRWVLVVSGGYLRVSASL